MPKSEPPNPSATAPLGPTRPGAVPKRSGPASCRDEFNKPSAVWDKAAGDAAAPLYGQVCLLLGMLHPFPYSVALSANPLAFREKPGD